MGKDRDNYKITCRTCGIEDELEMWMDDWLRWDINGMERFSGKVSVTGPQADALCCIACGTFGPSIVARRE